MLSFVCKQQRKAQSLPTRPPSPGLRSKVLVPARHLSTAVWGFGMDVG